MTTKKTFARADAGDGLGLRRRSFLKAGLASIGSAALLAAQSESRRPLKKLPYSPASYDNGSGYAAPVLRVFPFEGDAVTIPIPFQMWPVATDRSGTAIYGADINHPVKPGIFKVEFNPTRIRLMPGSEDIGGRLTASLDGKSLFVCGDRRSDSRKGSSNCILREGISGKSSGPATSSRIVERDRVRFRQSE